MPQVKAKVSAVAATSAGTSAAAAPPPRRWEGVDPALERTVLRACLDQAPERRRVREAFKDVQLNIDHCLFKGQYSGIGTKESYEVNSRGVEIFSKCWFPQNHRMKAIVCLCHGYGDTCTFFLDGIARKIASAGYGVFALDYPGFGLSEGLHGYIPSFDTLVDDVAEHFVKVKGQSEHRGLQSFLFGQSMGGAVALKVHFNQPNEWNGAILVAPMCKIADDVVPPWPVQQILIFLARLLPKGKLVPQKDLAELAFKEKKKQEQCSYNVIAYKDKPRLQTAFEMLRTTQEIESRLEEVCGLFLLCSSWFCYRCHPCYVSSIQLLITLPILTSIEIVDSLVRTLGMHEFAFILWIRHSWAAWPIRAHGICEVPYGLEELSQFSPMRSFEPWPGLRNFELEGLTHDPLGIRVKEPSSCLITTKLVILIA